MISESALEASLASIAASFPEVPGVLARVEGDGDTVVASVGVANRATADPMTAAHAFRIASNTKTFVAVAIVRLSERRLVDLDQPIGELLPNRVSDVLQRRYDLGAITVRHLLQHTSGIASHDHDVEKAVPASSYMASIRADPTHRWTAIEQIRFSVDRFPPTGAPGAHVVYSDTGYVVAGQILEHVSGLPLPQVLRTECRFDALGLSSTWTESLEPRPPTVRSIARVYQGDEDWSNVDCSIDLFGGGGLVSTAEDLVRFWRAVFGGELVSTGSLRTMLSTRRNDGREGDAGLGILRRTFGEQTWWTHSGYWGSLVIHEPSRDLTAVIFRNQSLFRTDNLAPVLDLL